MNSTFLLFFPFLFLTSSYVPRSQLSGWLHTVAGLNPVTYLLEGLRSLVSSGWQWGELGKAALAIALMATAEHVAVLRRAPRAGPARLIGYSGGASAAQVSWVACTRSHSAARARSSTAPRSSAK